jgi:hypothetical protein
MLGLGIIILFIGMVSLIIKSGVEAQEVKVREYQIMILQELYKKSIEDLELLLKLKSKERDIQIEELIKEGHETLRVISLEEEDA